MSRQDRFWIVWTPSNPVSPTVKHPTQVKAIDEARRLARTNEGEEYFVLRASHRVQKVNVMVTELDPNDDEVPF